MADMPQQPAPAPDAAGPGGPPQDQAPPDQGGAPDDANSPTKLIVGVDAGLSKIVQMLSQAQVDPKIKEMIGKSLEMYRQGVQALMSSGPGGPGGPASSGPPQPMGNGVSSPEAGGNPNAVPVP